MSDESSNAVGRGESPVGFAERVLRWIERKRLQAPAALLLEMHRPFQPLAWSAAVLLGGVLAPLVGPDYYRQVERLRDPAALDRVLERLRGG